LQSLYFILANNVNELPVRLWQKLIDFIRSFNLFQSIPPSTDEFNLRNERISTRLFVISFIFSMTILLTYTSLISVTKTVTIDTPTLTKYSNLYSKYSQTLACPCKEISIKYKSFLQVNYTLHQVCNSIFVNESFIEYYFTYRLNQTPFHRDFQAIGKYTFAALISFCRLMNKTLAHSLTDFYSNQYISSTITNEQLFSIQINSSFEQFISSTINHLLLSMQIIRDTTQANNLFSGELTNYDFLVVSIPEDPELSAFEYVQPSPNNFSNCSCAISALCVEQATIFNNDDIFLIPGLYVGCYIVEALLQSTLECFYNQICINTLQSYMNVPALDSSLLIRHNESSTIQELVNDLMVEDWNLTITYKDYYGECQPTHCSYTYVTRNDAIYIATTIFGLTGGLVTVLKLLIPRFVTLISRFICEQTRRVVPEM
jgi:hypothetical protein